MVAERSPSFQFYAKDWRDVKVRRMSLAAQGAYAAILADMWVDSKDQCSLLDCDPFIAKSLGVSLKVWLGIRCEIQHANDPLLIEKGGRLYSNRLKKEAVKQRKYSDIQREKGVAGAKKRWGNTNSSGHSTGNASAITEGMAKGMPGDSSSSSSSSLSSSRKKKRELRPMPDGWVLSDAMREYGRKKGMKLTTIEHEFEKCKNTHAESRFTESGWASRTWVTWVLNWISFGAKQVGSNGTAPMPRGARLLPTNPVRGEEMPAEVRQLIEKGGKSMP